MLLSLWTVMCIINSRRLVEHAQPNRFDCSWEPCICRIDSCFDAQTLTIFRRIPWMETHKGMGLGFA